MPEFVILTKISIQNGKGGRVGGAEAVTCGMRFRSTTKRAVKALAVSAAVAVLAAACSSPDDAPDASTDSGPGATSATAVPQSRYGPPPAAPVGELSPQVEAALDDLFASLTTSPDLASVEILANSGDPRVGWLFADLLRFVQPGAFQQALADGFETLTSTTITVERSLWGEVTNRMIAWDVDAPPGYRTWKSQLFELIEPDWAPFFADEAATIDWRWVSWGGVLIDDRPIDDTDEPCPSSCIPALNDPALTDAAGGSWFDDDGVVFGVVVNGEAVAFPKNIMEVHEMVNTTIGGRRIGMPYCTLCGSAQAYFTDDVVDRAEVGDSYELRTSGLLSRSNKVMFELQTMSVFDTFTGVAVTGPLRELGVRLEPVSVRASTWGDWKTAYPDTKIVAQDGGIGRNYPADPLRGRDDDGPIFPIGDADPRLGLQEAVLGIALDNGTFVAVPVEAATAALEAGGRVEIAGVKVVADDAGLVALGSDNQPLATHQAFWFAWSQFHPDTLLWEP